MNAPEANAASSERFDSAGHVTIDGALDEAQLEELHRLVVDAMSASDGLLTRGGVVFGARNLLFESPRLHEWLRDSPLFEVLRGATGISMVPINAIYFDKPLAANWKVPPHQDRVMPVKTRPSASVDGFSGWSEKGGVPHVIPPDSVLEDLVAARVHFDDTPESNGALRVWSGSHDSGVLDPEAIKECCGGASTLCEARRGDVMLMRPLLVHASSCADQPRSRRILHVVYASEPLAAPLSWRAG